MDICYASNEAYAPYLAASMTSLILHNADAGEIHFHIIANSIGAESRERLRRNAAMAVAACKNASEGRAVCIPRVSVGFYPLENLSERAAADDTGSYDVSMLGRFFIGELLPERVETVLYLDCDTIVCGSLKQLFTRSGLPLASGAPEPTIYRSILKQLGLTHANDCYLNSGVLLINLAAWRAFGAGQKLLSFYRLNGSRLFCGDQDAVNYVLRGQLGLLSPRYNFFTNYRYFHYQELLRQSPSYERAVPNKAQFRRLKKKPQIIHYMGAERPWLRGSRNPYRRKFEEALSKSAYMDIGKVRGKEAELCAYHLMNLATWICPPVRRIFSAAFERKKVLPRIRPLLTEEQADA